MLVSSRLTLPIRVKDLVPMWVALYSSQEYMLLRCARNDKENKAENILILDFILGWNSLCCFGYLVSKVCL